MPPPIASPIDDLRHARDVLARQNNSASARVVASLDRYLNVNDNHTLDHALGLAPGQSFEHWRTAERRCIRDRELRTLCQRFMPGLSAEHEQRP